jgi:membrane-associated phospholipid phosphatase
MTSDGRFQKRFLLAALVCFCLLMVCYMGLVCTAWGHQLNDDAYLGRGAFSRKIVTWDAVVLMRVTGVTVVSAAGVLLLIGIVCRSAVVGLVAVIGFGTAVVGAEILKGVFPWRALVPDDAKLPDLQLGSYPSGHATIATAFALGLLLVSPARWRPWLAAFAGFISSMFAAGVLLAGWHRASDALGALAWSGLCMNLAAVVAVRFNGRPAIDTTGRALLYSPVFGILMIAGVYLVSLTAAHQYPYGEISFFLLTGVIIAGSFSLTAWYAWLLRDIDFSKVQSPIAKR